MSRQPNACNGFMIRKEETAPFCLLAVVGFCVCLWFGGTAWPAANPYAPETNRCEICTGAFSNLTAYTVKDRVRQVKRSLCKACSDLKTVCWACKVLPSQDSSQARR